MDLGPAAKTAVDQCLALTEGEECVVVTDDERRTIGDALYEAASALTESTVEIVYPPGDQHGEEPPAPVGRALRECDAFLAPTTKSISHTRARSAATDAGVRGATLPEITEEVFVTGLDADYDAIAESCRAIEQQVADAEELHVTCPNGTDLRVRPGDRDWRLDTGIVHDPGTFTNLPAGEVFVSPTTADGRYVIDWYPREGIGSTEVVVEVEDGYVTDIGHPVIADAVETAAESVGRDAYNLAEVGIGANTAVSELVGSILLDEKAAGTVHVAIGDDAGIGGDTDAPIHLDGIITQPTVEADGEVVQLPAPT